MKRLVSTAVVVLFLTGAALASQAPQIDARLSTATTAKEIREAKGPLKLTFQVAITNGSDASVTLKRVEVWTDDTTGFTLRDGSKKANTTIAPGASDNIQLVAKRLASKNLAPATPVQVFVRLTFNGPDGKFVKEFSEFIQ